MPPRLSHRLVSTGATTQRNTTLALPHDLEAEKAVLGAVLVDLAHLTTAATIVAASHFYRHAHQIIFETMLDLAQRGSVIDFVTLKNELARRGTLDAVGGPVYIASLPDGMPRAVNVEHYAQIVRRHAVERDVISAGERLVNAAYRSDTAEMTDALRAVAESAQPGGFRRTQRTNRIIATDLDNIRVAVSTLMERVIHDAFSDRVLVDGNPLDDGALDDLWVRISDRFHFSHPDLCCPPSSVSMPAASTQSIRCAGTWISCRPGTAPPASTFGCRRMAVRSTRRSCAPSVRSS